MLEDRWRDFTEFCVPASPFTEIKDTFLEGTSVTIAVNGDTLLSSLSHYHTELKSLNQGSGTFTMELSHYDPVPSNIQQELVAEQKVEKEGRGLNSFRNLRPKVMIGNVQRESIFRQCRYTITATVIEEECSP